MDAGKFSPLLQHQKWKANERIFRDKKAVGPENMTKFQNNIKHTAPLRNRLAHGALRASNKKGLFPTAFPWKVFSLCSSFVRCWA